MRTHDAAAHGRRTPIAHYLGGRPLALDPKHQQLELHLLSHVLRIKPLRSLPSGPRDPLLGGVEVPTRLVSENPSPRGDSLRADRYERTKASIAINAASAERAYIFQKFSRHECSPGEIGFPGVGGGGNPGRPSRYRRPRVPGPRRIEPPVTGSHPGSR